MFIMYGMILKNHSLNVPQLRCGDIKAFVIVTLVYVCRPKMVFLNF